MKSYQGYVFGVLLSMALPAEIQAAEVQITTPSGDVSTYQTDALLADPGGREIVIAYLMEMSTRKAE